MDDENIYLNKAKIHKEVFESKKAKAIKEKGLIIVYTGSGKGKTTAALGMAVRILGHNMNLGVIQFIKGALNTAERNFFLNYKNCVFKSMGDGYTWNTQDRNQDIVSANRAWTLAQGMITSNTFDMIILDELNIILKHKYLDEAEIINFLINKPAHLHIVITGRNASTELIKIADLVSEVKCIKHPYQEQGIKAQRGIEF